MVNSDGKDVTPKDITDYVQTLTVTKLENRWKVSSFRTKEVSAVSAKDCGA